MNKYTHLNILERDYTLLKSYVGNFVDLLEHFGTWNRTNWLQKFK